jgi:hypothetical protein
MYGHREVENGLSSLEWITGGAFIVGLCLLFCMGLYRALID